MSYVGQTVKRGGSTYTPMEHILQRWKGHVQLALVFDERNDFEFKSRSKLSVAIQTYGPSNSLWEREVLDIVSMEEIADEREEQFITDLNTYRNGLNSTPNGQMIPFFKRNNSLRKELIKNLTGELGAEKE